MHASHIRIRKILTTPKIKKIQAFTTSRKATEGFHSSANKVPLRILSHLKNS
jgi:hypothetical protein